MRKKESKSSKIKIPKVKIPKVRIDLSTNDQTLKAELISVLGKLNLMIVSYYSFTETYREEKSKAQVLQMKKEIVQAADYAYAELLHDIKEICKGTGDGDCPDDMKWCEDMKKCIWNHMSCDLSE